MSCKPAKPGLTEADCKCENAVMRAYEGLLHEGDQTALTAAKRVYRFHHPEDPRELASLTVERWVNAGHFH